MPKNNYIVLDGTGSLLHSHYQFEPQELASTTVNRVNMHRIPDKNPQMDQKLYLSISKSWTHKNSQNMEYKSKVQREKLNFDLLSDNTAKRVQSKHNRKRKVNRIDMGYKEDIKDRLKTAGTFKLTGLNNTHRSSMSQGIIRACNL